MLKNGLRGALALLACCLVVACGRDKRLADTAIKTAEKAVATGGPDVEKYAAEQWKGVTDSLAAAKENFAKGEYKAAIASVENIGQKVLDAQAAATAQKTRLENAWTDLAAGVPKMVDAIKSRVDILSASKKLPKGLDRATLESAQAGLAAATQSWADASAAFKAGNLQDALAKANMVKEKAAQIMQSLGMSVPEAAGGAAPVTK
ncbi:MAG TPA: hypothetical protein VMR54_10070 [Thermoanaerobaculia bacterium]|nr:hypothetical protein [Thermoanaerobaculia bacterium]